MRLRLTALFRHAVSSRTVHIVVVAGSVAISFLSVSWARSLSWQLEAERAALLADRAAAARLPEVLAELQRARAMERSGGMRPVSVGSLGETPWVVQGLLPGGASIVQWAVVRRGGGGGESATMTVVLRGGTYSAAVELVQVLSRLQGVVMESVTVRRGGAGGRGSTARLDAGDIVVVLSLTPSRALKAEQAPVAGGGEGGR